MNKILRRHGDEFEKFHGAPIKKDWEQVTALERLTRGIPEIRSPAALRMDLDTECIWYEWLGDLPMLITLQGSELEDAVCRAGRTLSQVHEASASESPESGQARGELFPLEMFEFDQAEARKIEARLPLAFFHGDCWHGNFLIDSSESCVLIDPVQSPWLFGEKRFDRASPIVDLATLHMSLLVSMKIGSLLKIDVDRQLALGDLLLDSYLPRFDACSLRNQVLRLSNAIATKYVSSYPVRINFLVGWIKLLLSKRVIATAATRTQE